MNYLAEILAFEQWLESHYLPISSQLLWYKLMYLSNKSGWSEWVVVDNLRLMAAVQMSREATFIKARDELIKAGLVEYRKGKKGSPNSYRMKSIIEINAFKNVVQREAKKENTFKSEVKSEVKSVVKSEVKSEVKSVVESVDIYKQKHKHKQNNIPSTSPLMHFEEFWTAYPNQQRRALTEKAYCDLVLSETVTEEALVKSAQNYAEYVQITGDKSYLPNNFLEKHVFEDFLPENYRKPDIVKTQYGICENHTLNVQTVQKNRIDELVKEQVNSVQNGTVPEVMY